MEQLCKSATPHVAKNSGENEWYTPPEFIEAARAVMGGIDCDPASSHAAQHTIKATTYFTKEDNGLTQTWRGRVWMNPPYQRQLIGKFVDRLIEHVEFGNVTQAVAMVNNGTETKWGQALLSACQAVSFPAGRIRYLDATGKLRMEPLQGQMLAYFGSDANVFCEYFSVFGATLLFDCRTRNAQGTSIQAKQLDIFQLTEWNRD